MDDESSESKGSEAQPISVEEITESGSISDLHESEGQSEVVFFSTENPETNAEVNPTSEQLNTEYLDETLNDDNPHEADEPIMEINQEESNMDVSESVDQSTVEESVDESNIEEPIAEKSNPDASMDESNIEESIVEKSNPEVSVDESNIEESIVENSNPEVSVDESNIEESIVEKSNPEVSVDESNIEESMAEKSNPDASVDESNIEPNSEVTQKNPQKKTILDEAIADAFDDALPSANVANPSGDLYDDCFMGNASKEGETSMETQTAGGEKEQDNIICAETLDETSNSAMVAIAVDGTNSETVDQFLNHVTADDLEGPIDQGKFKKKAALASIKEETELMIERDDVIIKQEATEFLEGGVTRTGRVVKRKKFHDEVEGLELDDGIDIISETVAVKKPRTKFSPMRPVVQAKKIVKISPMPSSKLTVGPRFIQKTATGSRPTVKPLNVQSTQGVISLSPVISLRKDLIEIPKKPAKRWRPTGWANYDSETDEDDAPIKKYKRKVPDSYYLAKHFIRPCYVSIHDGREFHGLRPFAAQRLIYKCQTCQKMKREPTSAQLCRRWFNVSVEGNISKTQPIFKSPDSTLLYINPCGSTPGTIMMKVTQRETTSSFVMNQSAYTTLAGNLNKCKQPHWPHVPLYPKTVKNLSFPTILNLSKYMPPVAPLTLSQKNNILNSIVPGASATKVKAKSLLELVQNINDEVTVVPPGSNKIIAQTNAKSPTKKSSMNCCPKCSQVYRGDKSNHVCPTTNKSPTGKRSSRIPNLTEKAQNLKNSNFEEAKSGKLPTKKLKLCTDCNLVYAEDEDHQCDASKNKRRRVTPAPTANKTPTAYQLCPHCIKIYKEDDVHVCPKKKDSPKNVAKSKPAPKVNPPKKKYEPKHFTKPGAKPKASPKKKEKTVDLFPPSPEAVEPDPEPDSDIMLDETPYATMCSSCSAIHMSNEEHKCGETKTEETYSILCASCSTLYKATENHKCVIKPVVVTSPPKAVYSPPKVMTNGAVEEVFSLPNLDGAYEEPKKPAAVVPSGVKECLACLKIYKQDLFAKHQCVPVKSTTKRYCQQCSTFYPTSKPHFCPKSPSSKAQVEKLLKSDRITSIKCDFCFKELAPSQVSAHDCPNKNKVVKNSEFPYKCQKCTYSTLSKKEFAEHSCIKGLKEVFKCEGCPKMFSKLEFLTKHMLNMCPNRQVKCELGCGAVLAFNEMKVHKCPKAPHKCRKCTAAFTTWSQLNVHEISFH